MLQSRISMLLPVWRCLIQLYDRFFSTGALFISRFIMIIVIWNVRGMGRAEKRAVVRKLVRLHKVDLLLIQE